MTEPTQEFTERRRHPRAVLAMPVTVMLDRRPVPGDLVDISAGGLRFTCRAEIAVENEVEVELRVMPDRQCTGSGTVVRTAGDRGFGVEFVNVNDAMRGFVADLRLLRPELQGEFMARVINPMVVVRGK